MTTKPLVSGTARDIIAYLERHNKEAQYHLLTEAGDREAFAPLDAEEEERLLDEAALIGQGRVRADLSYNREDIYFDRG